MSVVSASRCVVRLARRLRWGRAAPLVALAGVFVWAGAAAAELPESIDSGDYRVTNWNTWSNQPFSSARSAWGGADQSARMVVKPDLTRRISRLLRLDEDQRSLLDSIAEERNAEFLRAYVEHQEANADLQAESRFTRDWDAQQKQQAELLQRFNERREAVLDAFYEDVRLVLGEGQSSDWSLVERDRRRAEHLAPGAVIFEETLDPVSLMESIDASEEAMAAAAPILDDWAASVDGLLLARQRDAERLAELGVDHNELQFELQDLYRSGDWTPERRTAQEDLSTRMQELAKTATSHAVTIYNGGIRIAEQNLRAIERLRAELPTTEAAALDAAIETMRDRYAPAFTDLKRGVTNIEHLVKWSRVTHALMQLAPNEEDMIEAAEEQLGEVSPQQKLLISQMQKLATSFMSMSRPGVQAITPQQRERLQEIREEFEAEREPIVERLTRLGAAGGDEAAEYGRLWIAVPLPTGTVQLQRWSDDPEEMERIQAVMWDKGGADDDERELSERERLIRELHKVELRAMQRIRETLTVEQRLQIASH